MARGVDRKPFKQIEQNETLRLKEQNKLKKMKIAIICALTIAIMAFAGTASAYNAAYTATCYLLSNPPTIDGKWTGTEWSETGTNTFGTNGVWATGWTVSPTVYACFIIETADNTNDPGDYWVITFDGTAAGTTTEPNGGTAPQTDDFKLVVTGHDSPTVQWYQGTGSAWKTVATPSAWTSAVFSEAQSLSSSPQISAPHYILEFYFDKTDTSFGQTIVGYDWASYVAYYDAHAGGNGLQSWPPAPANDTDPDSWGYVPYQYAAIPETPNIGIVIALSSVAVVAGSVIFSKRPLTKLAKKHSL
jgi:hypothetical protein